jgi:hypothetical protein
MSKKRIVIITSIISFVVGGITLYLVPTLAKTVSKWGNNELLLFITIMGIFVAFSIPFIENLLQKRKQQALYQIHIHVTVLENRMVSFSASIENVGEKQIVTKTSNLYIDRGIEKPKGKQETNSETTSIKYYDFPFLLKHIRKTPAIINGKREERPDCILCTRCRDDVTPEYPKEGVDRIEEFLSNKEFFCTNVHLQHLSEDSIKYVNPKEKFSEDVIMKFERGGVYRVIFVVTTVGDADCECATKMFYISE